MVLVYHDHLPMDSIVFARRLMNTFLRCFVLFSCGEEKMKVLGQRCAQRGKEGREPERKVAVERQQSNSCCPIHAHL